MHCIQMLPLLHSMHPQLLISFPLTQFRFVLQPISTLKNGGMQFTLKKEIVCNKI